MPEPQSIIHQAIRLTQKSKDFITKTPRAGRRLLRSRRSSNSLNKLSDKSVDASTSREFDTASLGTLTTSASSSRHSDFSIPRQLDLPFQACSTIVAQPARPSMLGRFEPVFPSLEDDNGEFGNESFRSSSSERKSQSVVYGRYRTITQNELFQESFNNDGTCCVIHFYDGSSRSAVSQNLDLHMKELAKKFKTCKFLRINGNLAPFFTGKLGIKTLPTILVLRSGDIVDRVSDFESLGFFGIREEWDRKVLSMWIKEATEFGDDNDFKITA